VKGRNTQEPRRLPVSRRYVHAPSRRRLVRPGFGSVVERLEIVLPTCLVLTRCLAVDARSSVLAGAPECFLHPFDVDVVEKVGDEIFLTGKSQFRPERVSAYEIGYRGQPAGEL